MVEVLVMLSTYNGERYIKEQLDSLYRQKDVNKYPYPGPRRRLH